MGFPNSVPPYQREISVLDDKTPCELNEKEKRKKRVQMLVNERGRAVGCHCESKTSV